MLKNIVSFVVVFLALAGTASAQTGRLQKGQSVWFVMMDNNCSALHLSAVLKDSDIDPADVRRLPIGTKYVLDSCSRRATRESARMSVEILKHDQIKHDQSITPVASPFVSSASSLASLKAEVAAANAKVSNVETEVKALDAEVKALRTEVAALEAKVAAQAVLNSEIAAVKAANDRLKEQANNARRATVLAVAIALSLAAAWLLYRYVMARRQRPKVPGDKSVVCMRCSAAMTEAEMKSHRGVCPGKQRPDAPRPPREPPPGVPAGEADLDHDAPASRAHEETILEDGVRHCPNCGKNMTPLGRTYRCLREQGGCGREESWFRRPW